MQRTITILEDDLDGSEGSETVSFALDGIEYAIDLNEAHANELREALSRFTQAARKTGGRARTTRPSASNASEIRKWALSQGLQVNSRGRIQADIVEKYHAAKR
ncbi:Lsr2 protein [Arthrobacter sp. ok909]|uniref:histone-like nucleoid-structuring protein Lsr2 n=1 Tax=Arthrobacter sp. ok909 TaxID=1761746 RepID=UPI000881A6B3|nr:Lsr2 family protein [Arthrobacter sp. ok909]SDP65423.1 Lsr2 protein [Arthrobacter sp. ok909]